MSCWGFTHVVGRFLLYGCLRMNLETKFAPCWAGIIALISALQQGFFTGLIPN
jgi:hypothetical protein